MADGPADNAAENAAEQPGSHYVQSLERGLAVIRAFGEHAPALTLSEVARRTELTRAAARRFLLTLADLGYVSYDGKYFSLTARVLELGYSYLSSISLPEVAHPHLERLSGQVHESCSASVLEGTDVVYIARVAVSRIMAVRINVGTRFPAHATSMGHVLLAGLDETRLEQYLDSAELDRRTSQTITTPVALRTQLDRVREQGYALVDQELEEGLRSVAAPVTDRAGRVIAAVNVSTHVGRVSTETVRAEIVPALLSTCARIEGDLAVSARSQPAGD